MPAGRRREPADIADLVQRTEAGDLRAVARLISLVEQESPALRAAAVALARSTGRSRVVGLTGAPGVGKSTMTSALVGALRERGERVGVLAVDPSSPFSGGALLGDRIRMQEHSGDDGVFVRSLASRGRLGGLSAAVPQALRVLEAARCDVVLVETVGVGQAEVDIASLADTTIVVLAPGLGDGVQAAKAGLMEVADVFVVNKADRPGADEVVRDVRALQKLGSAASETSGAAARSSAAAGSDAAARSGASSAAAMSAAPGAYWRAPVLRASAAAGEGVAELLNALDRHQKWLSDGGVLDRRRLARARAEVESIALGCIRERFATVGGDRGLLDEMSREVIDGRIDPFTAADQLLRHLS